MDIENSSKNMIVLMRLDEKGFMGSWFLRGFQSPCLRHPPLASWPSLPPFSKIFVSSFPFGVPLPFKVFQTSSPYGTSSYPNPMDQPSLHIINRFKQISKDGLTTSTITFYQKLILYFLIPFKNMLSCLNLWDMSRFIFRWLRMTFFIKLSRQKKYLFFKCITQFWKE